VITVDCASLCATVGQLCAGRSDIDSVWLDACRTQCNARLQLEPSVAALEASCVGAASTCDVGIACVATPTAPGGADAGGDRAAASTDAAADARADTRVSVDLAPAPSSVRATVDGTAVVFDQVMSVSVLADVVSIVASTSDLTRRIWIYTSSGTGFVPTLPATYGCTSSDIGRMIYTISDSGPIDSGTARVYGDNPNSNSPCSVTYSRLDGGRVQGTFVATVRGPPGSVMLTNGVIDVSPR
jgi:hypothetical protein